MNDFRKMSDRRLDGLCFQPLMEETLRAARQHDKPRLGCKMRPALAFALVLLAVLLAATALAAGLRWSTQMNAVNTAQHALQAQYGLTAEVLGLFTRQVEKTEDGWQVIYHIREDLADKAGSYTVSVAKDGTAQVQWSLEGVNLAESWNAEQLAQWKLEQDETFRTIDDGEYNPKAIPNQADGVELAEGTTAQPVIIANRALRDVYSLTNETLALFTASASQNENGGDWLVLYQPKAQPLWGYDQTHWVECAEKMGQYQVHLSPDMQTINSCTWSLDGVDDSEYPSDSYGQAMAFSQNELEYLLQTIHRRAEINSRYMKQNQQGWLIPLDTEPISVEDSAALDAILLEAGFTGNLNHVLPREGDVTMEQAKEIFYQAVHQQYGTTREIFDSSVYAYADLTREDSGRQWFFWLQSQQELCTWSVHIDAATGEILQLYYDVNAAGNG